MRFNANFSLLFNSYYKSAGPHWRQGERGHLSRPTVSEVLAYRQCVDEKLFSLLATDSTNQELMFDVELGLQHEQQHQELLLMDIKYILGSNPSMPRYCPNTLEIFKPPEDRPAQFSEGLYEIGYEGDGFAFDNEMPRHKAYLYPFAVGNRLISNAQFLKFIESGGYQNSSIWLSEGWDWVVQNHVHKPLYWFEKGGQWHEFTLHGIRSLDLDAPVTHVSYYEADAYAAWVGQRLPTEAELEVYLSQPGAIDYNPEILHPNNTAPQNGQVWTWTQSHYSPYPRFKKFRGLAEEYNGKFMCKQFVLKGGCVATPQNHYRPSYRNFYQPQQRWMFSGIRLAMDI